MSKRKVADCRHLPGDNDCTLRISGNEDEVLDIAVVHAVLAHGHTESKALREQIRSILEDEEE